MVADFHQSSPGSTVSLLAFPSEAKLSNTMSFSPFFKSTTQIKKYILYYDPIKQIQVKWTVHEKKYYVYHTNITDCIKEH